MSKLNVQFNAGQIEPSFGGGSNLPIGRHKVSINGFDQKATKGNTGGLLEVSVVCIEGEFMGCSIKDRLNIFNQSTVAVKIALQKLSAYCHVLGRPDWDSNNNELDELCNIPFYVDVVPQKDSTYTEIGALFDINGNDPKGQAGRAPATNEPQQQQPSNQAAQQPAETQTTPAWGGANTNTQPQPAAAQPAATNTAPAAWGQQQQPSAGAAGGAPAWAQSK